MRYTDGMNLRLGQWKSYLETLEKEIISARLSQFCLFDDETIAFRLSEKRKLVASFSLQTPRLYLSSTFPSLTSMGGNFAATMRKEIGGGKITKLSLRGNDRVIDIEIEAINEVYRLQKRHLLLEFVPGHFNYLLLDEEDKILAVLKPKSLDAPRPLLRGLTYPPLKNPSLEIKKEAIDFQEYQNACLKLEEEEIERRRKQRYAPLFSRLKAQLASSKRKKENIQQDIEKASAHLYDGNYGDFIFMNMSSISLEKGQFEYEGKMIPLDKRISLAQNAESFYRKAKKAKATLEKAKENLARAEKEQEEAEILLRLFSFAEEEELLRLAKEFGLEGQKRKPKANAFAYLPYEVIDDGVSYCFGKNASQNDFLTFSLDTNKNHLWLHVKQGQGSHLMIRKENPTQEEIALGCELALLASHLEEGEIMVTSHANVRKGSVPGLAIVNEYRSYLIRNISEKARNLFAKAEKIKL